MKVNLHSGTGSARNITGIGFQPDFTIVKRRDNTGVWYNTDIVRGAGKQMYLNETGAMGGSASTTEITGFNSDGFNLGTDVGVNASGGTYVSYNFLGNNTTGSANTDGTISSTVSANTTSGFSIVKYTGTGSASTIGHGLGSAPKMVIVKSISTSGVWLTWHTGISINGQLQLQAQDAVYNPGTSIYWNSTLPTSSVFSVGTSGSSNASGTDYIAYCFADVTGYSKFGSYTGNASTDGPFFYTGFKPTFVLIKNTTTSTSWTILDNKRDSFNVTEKRLFIDSNDADTVGTNGNTDFLSNGVKIRTSHDGINASGSTYIYMAFAAAPLVGSNNVPANAR
jgi:hypothetical protein